MVDTQVQPAPPYDPSPRRGHRRLGMVLLALILSVVVIVGAVGLWYTRQASPSGGPGPSVTLTFAPGSSTAGIASSLHQHGVIKSATLFRYYVRVKGSGPFQAGDYSFRRNSSFGVALSVLEQGPSIREDRVTIPEGFTLQQIAARVGKLPGRSAARFMQEAQSGEVRSAYEPAGSNNLEGLLFPDTYFVRADEDEKSILQRMVAEFDSRAAADGVDQEAAQNGVTPYQAIIIASMVEREAKVPDDRAKIARVIYNRLQKGMLLQIDSTVVYALGGNKTQVLYSDLKVNSPYNTYLVKGLPPTPIASPGDPSLVAAVNPTPGPWLYYVVVTADGHHAFATTDAEQNANIELAHQRGLR